MPDTTNTTCRSSTCGDTPGTFSIAARDSESGALGVAIATGLIATGASAPFVSSRGAVLTQAFTEVAHGRHAIELVNRGIRLSTACEALLGDDPHANYRQLHGIDQMGRTFTFTGENCVDWCGHLAHEDHTVAGNMLANENVIEAMSDAFRTTDGELTDRLIAALAAGETAGGDERGTVSAALRVDASDYHLFHNLRVDYDTEPIVKLRTLYEHATEVEASLPEQAAEMLGDYPDAITDFDARWRA